MNVLFSILKFVGELLLNCLSDLFSAIFHKTPKGEKFDADFIPASRLLSRFNKGFSVTGNRAASIQDSIMHVLVVASSGAGKSTTILVPSLFNLAKHGNSCLVNDPSGEIANATIPYLKEQGYEILMLNFADAEHSCGYNPFAFDKSNSDSQKTNSMLVRHTLGTSVNDQFWNLSGTNTISVFTALTKTLEPKVHHYTTVRFLLESFITDPDYVDKLVASSNNPELIREYKMLLHMEEKVRSNVIATCRAALNIFSNPEVQKVTSFNSIDFASFRKKKTVLFIQNKISDLQFYSCLTSIFAEQFFGALMSKLPDKKDNHVFFLFDEFSSLYLPSIQVALSNLRKFNCGILLVIQDYNQLKHIYGTYQAEAIRSNTYIKIYFGNQPLEVCKDLEQIAGLYEFVDKDGRKQVRQLIKADQMRRLKKNRALIFMGGNMPIYGRMKPYYRNWRYMFHAKKSMPEFSSSCPFNTVPLPTIPSK